MTKPHRNSRPRCVLLVLGLLSFILLTMNALPVVHYSGFPYIPTPGSGYTATLNGVREQGWPLCMKAERFVHPFVWGNKGFPASSHHGAIKHLLGIASLKVDVARYSLSAALINLSFWLASCLLSVDLLSVLYFRRFRIRTALRLIASLCVVLVILRHAAFAPGLLDDYLPLY